MDLVRKAFELFTAIRAKDWPNIRRLVGEILPIVLGGLTGPPPVPAMALAQSPMASKTLDELVDETEAAINQCAPQNAAAAPMQGPIIDALKPLLGKLLLKILLGIG